MTFGKSVYEYFSNIKLFICNMDKATSYPSFYFFAYSEFVPGRSGLTVDYGSLNQSGNATSCCPRLLCTQGYLYDPVLAKERAAFISRGSDDT